MKNNKFVKSYLKNLEKFIKKHNLDSDLYSDIEENIFEKLQKIENPTTEDIKNVLKEIGSPEEIFKDEIGQEEQNFSDNKFKNFWIKFKQKTSNIVFLGVFKNLGELTGINANIYRIIFIMLFFFSLFVGEEEFAVVLVCLYFLTFFVFLTGIVRFFIAGIILFLLLVSLILALVFFGLYLGNFNYENIYFFKGIGAIFPISMIITIFSLVVLTYVFGKYLFKSGFSWKMFLTGIIAFIIAISLSSSVLANIILKYSKPEIETLNFSLDIPSSEVLNFYINSETNPYAFMPQFYELHKNILYENSLDGKLHIEVEKVIFGNKDYLEENKNYLKDSTFEIRNNQLVFIPKINDGKYSFHFTVFKITKISVPANLEFKSSWSRNNLNFPEGYAYLSKYRGDCELYFLDENGNLNCKIDENIILAAKKEFIKFNISEIMPLKFKKTHYYWENMQNFKEKGDGIISFSVSDGQADFLVEVKIFAENEILNFSDVKILEVKGWFHSKYYQNPNIITDNFPNLEIVDDIIYDYEYHVREYDDEYHVRVYDEY